MKIWIWGIGCKHKHHLTIFFKLEGYEKGDKKSKKSYSLYSIYDTTEDIINNIKKEIENFNKVITEKKETNL